MSPYKSDSQRRKFHAMAARGEMSKEKVKEWDKETGSKDLPEHVKKKCKRSPKIHRELQKMMRKPKTRS